jgi:hypothetical protein
MATPIVALLPEPLGGRRPIGSGVFLESLSSSNSHIVMGSKTKAYGQRLGLLLPRTGAATMASTEPREHSSYRDFPDVRFSQAMIDGTIQAGGWDGVREHAALSIEKRKPLPISEREHGHLTKLHVRSGHRVMLPPNIHGTDEGDLFHLSSFTTPSHTHKRAFPGVCAGRGEREKEERE